MRQHIATLVHIALDTQAVKRLHIVRKESRSRDSKAELPCTFALNIGKRSTSHRCPTVHSVEHLHSSALAVGTSGTKTNEQCTRCIALYIIIGAVGYRREEQLAARVFPHIAVVVRSNGTHTLFCNTIVYKQLVAVVCCTHLHLRLIRKLGSPTMAVNRDEVYLSLVQQTTNLNRPNRGS